MESRWVNSIVLSSRPYPFHESKGKRLSEKWFALEVSSEVLRAVCVSITVMFNILETVLQMFWGRKEL